MPNEPKRLDDDEGAAAIPDRSSGLTDGREVVAPDDDAAPTPEPAAEQMPD
jgi:hypothetical protein